MGDHEAFACVWACIKWNLYLYGHSFPLRTDHHVLTVLLSISGTGPRPLMLHAVHQAPPTPATPCLAILALGLLAAEYLS